MEEIYKEKGLVFTEKQLAQFNNYLQLITEWNNKINLTAIENEGEIIYKHFLDSLLCLKINLSWAGKKIIDIGTGAGFPGIPLKIALEEDNNFTLLDSLKKRIVFLEEVLYKLGLENISCIHGRAEDFARDEQYRENYDIALARAVAKLPILMELCTPFLKKGGIFIAMKGPEGLEELEQSVYAQEELGLSLLSQKEFYLKDEEHKRIIFAFRKERETSSKYPRRAGIVQKRPLIKNN